MNKVQHSSDIQSVEKSAIRIGMIVRSYGYYTRPTANCYGSALIAHLQKREMKSRDHERREELRDVLAASDETWEQLNSAIEYGDMVSASRLRKKIEELAKECDRLTEDDMANGEAD